MKRRDFVKTGVAGAIGAGLSGSSIAAAKARDIMIEKKLAPVTFKLTVPKPQGTMPMSEIGKTGIKVSKFAFGAHMSDEAAQYYKQRAYMIREAFDLGINLFDVYEDNIKQYEPMGKHLAPIKNDTVVSIVLNPYGERTIEQELERDLRIFGKDHIDMIRIHAWAKTGGAARHSERWNDWEKCFKFKEQGKVRAVGLPIHSWEDLKAPIDAYPLDFVIFPYNFYHNLAWEGHTPISNYDKLPKLLRSKGIGVITMKPFCGDFLVLPLKEVADKLKKNPDINFIHAALRYVINSKVSPDTTLTGMYNLNDIYENVAAYYQPTMSKEEKNLLEEISKVAKTKTQAWLPDHYKWLDDWKPESQKV